MITIDTNIKEKGMVSEKSTNISFSVKEGILLSLKEDTEEFTQNLRFLSTLMLYRKNAYR